ncbi:MAG: hypothetical protein CMF62_10960 [Magnetococcales bacterium]|nr:hypothetical protein [Magnetococcales bacterium]|tara:strand:- start:93782 stop:94834 length:1053 start_codon:yes stop_codon:yes gene_type:complete
MSLDPSDVMLASVLRENFYRPLRLLCKIFQVNEAPLMAELDGLKTVADLLPLFEKISEESPVDECGFQPQLAPQLDEVGVYVLRDMTILIGSPSGVAFAIDLKGEELMLYASTFGLSTSMERGCAVSPGTEDELAVLSHDAKRLLFDALNAFPLPPVGDGQLVRDAILRKLNYRPVEKFYLEKRLADQLLMAFDAIDAARGVAPDEDESFARCWAELNTMGTEPATGEFITKVLHGMDDNLSVEFFSDPMEPIITELILDYQMPDDRELEVCVDMIGVSISLGFALFLIGEDAVFEPAEAACFFRNTSDDLRASCLRVLDFLAIVTEGNCEVERRRARRVVSANLQTVAA